MVCFFFFSLWFHIVSFISLQLLVISQAAALLTSVLLRVPELWEELAEDAEKK